MTNSNDRFDLEERTKRFGRNIIGFCKSVKKDSTTTSMINQRIRSGTSIGANYCEANEASSRRDFINKIGIARKESKETKYWLEMITYTAPETEFAAQNLGREANELLLIFAAIARNAEAKIK